MGHLSGLKAYLDAVYNNSIFDEALDSKKPWEVHLHGHRIVRARVLESLTYDLKLDIEGQGEEDLLKIQVKLLYPAEQSESVRPLTKMDKKTRALALPPILSAGERYHIKNKSLFPLIGPESHIIEAFTAFRQVHVFKDQFACFGRRGSEGYGPLLTDRHQLLFFEGLDAPSVWYVLR